MDNIKEKEERLGSMLIDVLIENLGGFKVLFNNKSAKTKEDMFSAMGRTAIRWCAQENNADVLSNWNKPHVSKRISQVRKPSVCLFENNPLDCDKKKLGVNCYDCLIK